MFFNSKNKQERLREMFFDKLFLLNYSKDGKKVKELKEIADKVDELRGWPNDSVKFWNAEAFGWREKIKKEVREFISKELAGRTDEDGLNLFLGSGAVNYLKNSVLVDISEEMLKLADGDKKIVYDLEYKLPFKDNSFDSVCLVFVINYIKNIEELFSEIKRILKDNGKIIIVQSKVIDDFYSIQEKKRYSVEEIREMLNGLKIDVSEKRIMNKTLLFLEAKVYK